MVGRLYSEPMRTASALHHLTADTSTDAANAHKVGDGATILQWTDRAAGTIIELTDKHIVVQEDTATRTDTNGMSECQDWAFTADPNGRTWTFTKRKDGKFYEEGTSMGKGPKLLLGVRRKYHDYSF